MFYPFVTEQEEQGYGRLNMHVKEARDLIAADFSITGNSTSDPYVKILFGTVFRTKEKTKIVNQRYLHQYISILVY